MRKTRDFGIVMAAALACAAPCEAAYAPARAARSSPAGLPASGQPHQANNAASSLSAVMAPAAVIPTVRLTLENVRTPAVLEPSAPAAPAAHPVSKHLESAVPILAPSAMPAADAPALSGEAAKPDSPGEPSASLPATADSWRSRAARVAMRGAEMRRHFESETAAAVSPISYSGSPASARTAAKPPRALTTQDKARFGFPRDEELVGAFSDGDREVLVQSGGRNETRRLEGRLLLRVALHPSEKGAGVRSVSYDGGATWHAMPAAAAAGALKRLRPVWHILGRVRGRAPRPVMTQARQMWRAVEDFWSALYPELRRGDRAASLVLYEGSIDSPAGVLTSVRGPVYLPKNRRTYLPQDFHDAIVDRFGGDGGFARLYVLAHEYGHHIQNHIGLQRLVARLKKEAGPADARRLDVMVELHADALAGFFAAHAQRAGIVEPGDLEVALGVIGRIGDDSIRRSLNQSVRPDTFTHGSSAQRVEWFRRGMAARSLRELDPFGDAGLARKLSRSTRARLPGIRAVIASAPRGD